MNAAYLHTCMYVMYTVDISLRNYNSTKKRIPFFKSQDQKREDEENCEVKGKRGNCVQLYVHCSAPRHTDSTGDHSQQKHFSFS